MFDVWYGEIELTTLILVISVVLLLPAQLLLCFKVRSRAIRLLPVSVLTLLAAAFIVMSIAVSGWDGLGYIFLAIFAGIMIVMCGVGWGIWAIVKMVKKSKALHLEDKQ